MRIKYALFLCLLVFIKSSVLAQENTVNLDSLKNIIRKNNADTNTAKALTATQKFYFQKGQFDSSLFYCRQSLELAKKLKDKKLIARSYYGLGITYTSLTQYDSAAYYLEMASSFFKDVNDNEMLVQYYNAWALLYNYQSNNTKGIEYMLKAAEVLEKNAQDSKLGPLLPQILGNIGYLFEMEKQHDKNVFYQYKALLYRNLIKDSTHFVVIFTNLFNGYTGMGKLDSAKKYLDSSAFINASVKNLETQIYIYNNYGFYYEHLKDTAAALPWYLKAYNLADSMNHYYYKAPVAGSLAKDYIFLNQIDKAEYYAKIANSLSLELKNYGVAADTYELLKQVEEKRGNYKKALAYFELYRQYRDSSTTAETQQNILTLEAKYENEKKEKEIAALKISNTEKELVVVKRNRLLIIGAILAAALLLIFALVTRNSRQKQTIAEKEQKVQQQQIQFLEKQQQVVSMQSMLNGQEAERTRIAKDLHDGLGGLFSTIKMQLSTLKHDDEQLDKNPLFLKSYELVNNASVEVRRIAHNMMPEVLMKLGLVDAVRDMCSNINAGKLLQVRLQAYGMEERLNNSTEVTLYRIVQELLNNIIKHAHATEAIVQFNREGNRLSITVEDNGKGFNTRLSDERIHAGLETVQSRVNYLNGNMSIESEQGLGTTIMMDFLLNG